MFGPQASSLLQRARNRCHCAEEVSESLKSRGKRRCSGSVSGLLYLFWWSDFHLSQSIELHSLPASAADQLALCLDSSTLNPQRVDFLGFVAGSLSRHHMRSSHLILRLHVHPILSPECGSGTLLRGAGTGHVPDSETRRTSLLPFGIGLCGLRGIVPIGM
ncbi:unnamed protein product [Gadus morhua 'NCC']